MRPSYYILTAMPQKNRESSHEVKLLALLPSTTNSKDQRGRLPTILLYQISISYHIKLGNLRFDPSGNAKNIFSRNIYVCGPAYDCNTIQSK